MLDIGYFLKIAKIISRQEKPMCTGPEWQKLVPAKTQKIANPQINSRRNFVPHGILILVN